MSEPMPTWLIEPSRVHALHARGLIEHGGLPGIRIEGCAEGAVDGAYTAGLYELDEAEAGTGEPECLKVACHLLYKLARSHCYNDGNKRVAWMAFCDQLLVLGLVIDTPNDDAAAFVEQVALGAHSVDAVMRWAEPLLIARPE